MSKHKIDHLSKMLVSLLFANVSIIFILIALTLNFRRSITPSTKTSSPNIVQNDSSNSLLGKKTIAWFFAGAFGYAAIYVVGKNIVDE